MKKQFKRITKSALAVVLTLCMIMSCVTVGIITTGAAQVDSDSTGDDGPSSVKIGYNWGGSWTTTTLTKGAE